MPDGIHIVSFNVPFPPDYGGVIDVYYKAKALSEKGLKVILHCFHYGRERSRVLEEEFFRVIYYHRKVTPSSLLSRSPFIVKTRKNDELLTNLRSNNWPILFEGLHTCAWLDHPSLAARIKMVRAHNVEHDYYHQLAISELNVFRKRYFITESKKLQRFEKILTNANHILTLSQNDQQYFERSFGSAHLLFPFHSELELKRQVGEPYAFYHGNLEVRENKQAISYLIKEVFNDLDIPLIVAGKGFEKDFSEFMNSPRSVQFNLNPNNAEMVELASKAAVHVLPTFQDTGFKLKLLYSLRSQIPVVVNPQMIEGTGLTELVIVAQNRLEFKEKIRAAINVPLTSEELEKRRMILHSKYSNESQAEKIIQLLD